MSKTCDRHVTTSPHFLHKHLYFGSYVLLIGCLCTTGFALHGLYDEFVDPFSSARKSLFYGFFIQVYEN
jgi:hypothetical protein